MKSVATTTNDQIPDEWQQWLQVSLVRQVPEEHLLKTMINKHFDPQKAKACIQAIKSRIPPRPAIIPIPPSPLSGDWQQWLNTNIENGVLEQALIEMASQQIRTAWAERSARLKAQSENTVYTYEDGLIAFEHSVTLADCTLPVLMAYKEPRIALLGSFLSKEECEALIAYAQPRMAPSFLLDQASAQPTQHPSRTSQGVFFKRGETPLIASIEQRIAALTGSPVEHGEGIQVLHYVESAEYRPHFDFFPPELPTTPAILKNGGQRVATLIAYLNTVEQGGETIFPKININVKPEQGNALYFSYTNSKGELDRNTFHGGAPVVKGEKWIMTKWVRQERFF